MRGILNSGHTKAAAHVIRNIEVNGEHKPRRFSTWAPKAIATIRALADTLEDRAIVVHLQRKPKAAKVARLRKRDSDEFAVLRRKAARWADDNFAKLTDPEPNIPEALNDRAADNWRPLLAIAELACARLAATGAGRGLHPVRRGPRHLDQRRAARRHPDGLRRVGRHSVCRPGDQAHSRPGAAMGRVEARQAADTEAACWAVKAVRHHLGGRCIPPIRHMPRGTNGFDLRRLGRPTSWSKPCGAPIEPSEARNRASADEMGTSSDFRSVREEFPRGSKNDNLSYSHAGLRACADRKPENGAPLGFDQARDTLAHVQPSPDDGLEMPAFLRRAPPEPLRPLPPYRNPPAHRNGQDRHPPCAQCNSDDGQQTQRKLAGDLVWLHNECVRFWLREREA